MLQFWLEIKIKQFCLEIEMKIMQFLFRVKIALTGCFIPIESSVEENWNAKPKFIGINKLTMFFDLMKYSNHKSNASTRFDHEFVTNFLKQTNIQRLTDTKSSSVIKFSVGRLKSTDRRKFSSTVTTQTCWIFHRYWKCAWLTSMSYIITAVKLL